MRRRLADERIDYNVANASISGDTTSGGRARLPALMQRLKPAIVIVELGANDALRGVPLTTTEDNLLAGIEDKPDMFQADQIHPTQQAQPVLLNNVWPTLKPLLRTPVAH